MTSRRSPAQMRPSGRDVAQSGSVPEWGSGGPGFESRRPDHFFLRNKQMGERWGERTGRALERRSSQPPRDFVAVKREYRRGQQQQKRQEKSPPSPLFLLLVCLFWVGLFFFLYMKWWTFGTNSRFEEWTIFLALSAFVAAAMTGWFLSGQLDVMRQQLADAHEAERPWIAFLDLEVEGRSGGLPLDGYIGATNSGGTPAKILSWTRGFAFTDEAPDDHPLPAEDAKQTGRILVPDRNMRAGFYVDWEKPSSGKVLHIFSEVRYADVRSGEEHFTRACWNFPRRDSETYCPKYNEAN